MPGPLPASNITLISLAQGPLDIFLLLPHYPALTFPVEPAEAARPECGPASPPFTHRTVTALVSASRRKAGNALFQELYCAGMIPYFQVF
jgi:hypothetical protein